ncbi:hypothetical protein GCM10010464_48590 [Pseudonocardia yunnanensis]
MTPSRGGSCPPTRSSRQPLAGVRRAILVHLYHPHWVFEECDMTGLEEPEPYRPDCFTTGNGGLRPAGLLRVDRGRRGAAES